MTKIAYLIFAYFPPLDLQRAGGDCRANGKGGRSVEVGCPGGMGCPVWLRMFVPIANHRKIIGESSEIIGTLWFRLLSFAFFG